VKINNFEVVYVIVAYAKPQQTCNMLNIARTMAEFYNSSHTQPTMTSVNSVMAFIGTNIKYLSAFQ
jgi:hypothetical protein